MGQFSVTIFAVAGSVLSDNQQPAAYNLVAVGLFRLSPENGR
jgi:hypothetical protein